MYPASGGSNDPLGLSSGVGVRRIPGVSQPVPIQLGAAHAYNFSSPNLVPAPAARAPNPIDWVRQTYASDPRFKEELLRLVLTECQSSAGQQSQAVGVRFLFFFFVFLSFCLVRLHRELFFL
jgi:hypothetical protein